LLGFYCTGKKVIASGLTAKKNSHAELETEQAGEIRATKFGREARRKTRDLDDTGARKSRGFETSPRTSAPNWNKAAEKTNPAADQDKKHTSKKI
jgi:hypothetical protein